MWAACAGACLRSLDGCCKGASPEPEAAACILQRTSHTLQKLHFPRVAGGKKWLETGEQAGSVSTIA
jgi:hypothetical protein